MLLRYILLFLSFSLTYVGANPLNESSQLITVISQSWDANLAEIHCYEKHEGKWKMKLGPIKASLGENGMAWGEGLHDSSFKPKKKEGDMKSPAGIYELGTAFGHTEKRFLSDLKLPYFQIQPDTEIIDDPRSVLYNRIVNTNDIANKDWDSTEKMGEIAVYLRGFFILHNYHEIKDGAGSAIFFHLWSRPGAPTAGCTACSFSDVEKIMNWLDPQSRPLIVQLPSDEYKAKATLWSLPSGL